MPAETETQPEAPLQEVILADDKDWFLQTIIETVIQAGVEMGVTLTVGGTTIGGLLISGKKYFEELSDSIGSLSKKDDDVESIMANGWRQYTQLYDVPEGAPDDWKPNPAGYIHLRDARVYAAGEQPIPENGMLWRGRLAAVDGFALGSFGPKRS